MNRSLRRIAAGLISLCAARFAIMLWASLTFSSAGSIAAPEGSAVRAESNPDRVHATVGDSSGPRASSPEGARGLR